MGSGNVYTPGVTKMGKLRKKGANQQDGYGAYNPTPKEIAEACERIQESWSDTDRRSANGKTPIEQHMGANAPQPVTPLDEAPVTIQVIQNGGLGGRLGDGER